VGGYGEQYIEVYAVQSSQCRRKKQYFWIHGLCQPPGLPLPLLRPDEKEVGITATAQPNGSVELGAGSATLRKGGSTWTSLATCCAVVGVCVCVLRTPTFCGREHCGTPYPSKCPLYSPSSCEGIRTGGVAPPTTVAPDSQRPSFPCTHIAVPFGRP
jgi:hypothetical protein